MKEILFRRAPMAGGERALCPGFRLLCQLQPSALPCISITGLDVFHGAGDVEYIAAALLRLRDQTQGMATKWMIAKQIDRNQRSAQEPHDESQTSGRQAFARSVGISHIAVPYH